MSVLVVGLSHRTAPVSVLERVALTAEEAGKLLDDVAAAPHVSEAVVLATCNRIEIYAEVEKFHGGVADVSELLARHTRVSLEELTPHLYVHYEDRAVQHLFSVACGLDSMVVGEGQILGQVKGALALAQRQATLARTFNELFQHALRVGKRAHTETDIDRAGQSLVSVGLAQATPVLGGLAGRSALVVGAGSMSALAAATLRREDAAEILVMNRTYSRGADLAGSVQGRVLALAELVDALAEVDIVVSCTGAAGLVVHADTVAAAAARRDGRPLFLLDLALPRDVDPAVRDIPGVTLADLESIAEALHSDARAVDVAAAAAIVADEVMAFAGWQHASRVAPTVAALRSMAADVVDAELARLATRLPALEPQAREEIAHTVRRVVDKLLHAPTVRVKELAATPDGASYAHALRELFDLDQRTIEAVIRADVPPPGGTS